MPTMSHSPHRCTPPHRSWTGRTQLPKAARTSKSRFGNCALSRCLQPAHCTLSVSESLDSWLFVAAALNCGLGVGIGELLEEGWGVGGEGKGAERTGVQPPPLPVSPPSPPLCWPSLAENALCSLSQYVGGKPIPPVAVPRTAHVATGVTRGPVRKCHSTLDLNPHDMRSSLMSVRVWRGHALCLSSLNGLALCPCLCSRRTRTSPSLCPRGACGRCGTASWWSRGTTQMQGTVKCVLLFLVPLSGCTRKR